MKLRALFFSTVGAAWSLVACAKLLGFEDGSLAPTALDGAPGSASSSSGADQSSPSNPNLGPDGGAPGGGDVDCGAPLGTSDNCAACGHSCLGSTCQSGKCSPIPLASGLTNPEGIALDDDHVYVALSADDQIVRIAKSGAGSAPLDDASAGGRPVAVATDGIDVYWAAFFSSAYSCPVAGCPHPAGPLNLSGNQPTRLTVHGTRVVWGEPVGTHVVSVDKSSGGDMQLLDDNAKPVAFANDATYVYVIDDLNNQVRRYLPAAVGGTTLTSTSSAPTGIAVGGGAIFVGVAPPNALVTIPVDGGTQTPFGAGTKSTAGLATDGDYLYWADEGDLDDAGLFRSDGCIRRCALATCTTSPPEDVACGLAAPAHVAVDATAVYFTTYGNTDPTGANFIMNAGSVMKVAKPPR